MTSSVVFALLSATIVSAVAAPPAVAPKPVTPPKAAPAPAATAEDCNVVDPLKIKAANESGVWKVTLGPNDVLDFGANEAEAKHAVEIIQHYHFTRECFVRRPNASMMYWKNGVAVPPGNMPGQDCITLHPETVQALYAARWKVMDGPLWLLDYGADQAAALEAAKIIHSYSLNRECFIARPHVVMQYWLAE